MTVAQNLRHGFYGLLLVLLNALPCTGRDHILDLGNHDFDRTPTVSLDSNWVFYWNALVSPEDQLPKQGISLDQGLTTWTALKLDGEYLPSYGHGTYHTKVILPPIRPSMALYLPKIFSSVKVWIGGELVLQQGKVGADSRITIHRRYSDVIPFQTTTDTVDIIIQVANFYHKNGGVTTAPTLGATYTLWRTHRVTLISDMVFVGSLLFIGISFLALYLFYWNEDKAILYFAIFCICWGYRSLSDGCAPLVYLFENMPWIWHSKIEYMALFIGGLMGNLFLNSLFKHRFHRLYPKLNTWFTWGLMGLVMLLPSFYYTYLLTPFFIVMVVDMCYAVLRLAGLVSKSGQSALALAAIFLAITVLAYHIFSYHITGRTSEVWVSIGYIVVFMLNSLLLGKRFAVAFGNLKDLQQKTQEQNQEIKAQTEMLNRMNRVLEAKVAQRTKNLEQLTEELDILLYRSSHDLKGPVSTIFGLAQLGEQLTSDREVLDLFHKIDTTNQNMADLIMKLGQVMLIREHKVQRENVDAEQIFVGLEQEVRNAIRRNDKLTIDFECQSEIIDDAFFIRTVLYQLLHNSAKWADVEDRPIHVRCQLTQNEESLVLQVVDDGPGLSDQFKEEIFDMYRVGNDRIPGHGMGLYLVRKVVEETNGTIDINSGSEGFTEFKVKWPVLQAFKSGGK